MATKKAQYAPPASQVDLEERLENGNKSNAVLSTSDDFEGPTDPGEGRDYRVEGNDVTGYVGTSPEYATYANETEKPSVAEEGPEAEVFETFADSSLPALVKVDGNVEYEGEKAAREAMKQASEDARASDEPAEEPAATDSSDTNK